MKNIFDRPCYHIEQVKKVHISEKKRKKFNSKSMLCAWVTKLCPAHCESCFFKSNMYHDGIPDEKYQFSEYGTDRLIQFINDSNNSYLMLSGGGEPMVRRDIVNKIIREVKTDRIVIVTSAIWAKSYEWLLETSPPKQRAGHTQAQEPKRLDNKHKQVRLRYNR